MKTSIVIVGGGITGLTLAYKLLSYKKKLDLPIEITLLEESNRLGGVIKSEAIDHCVIEHGPDAFLADRPELKSLLEELGLTAKLLPTNKNHRRAFVALKEKLVPLPSGFYMIAPTKWCSFIHSPLFSLAGKLRICMEAFLPPKKSSGDESIEHFLRRRFGNELFLRVGQPLLGSIYMGDVNLLSAQSSIPNFVALEQGYGSIIRGLLKTKHQEAHNAGGARYNLFSSFTDGTQVLVDKLIEQLSDIQINLNTKLQGLHRQRNKWQLQTEAGQLFEADMVVIATPANLAANFVKEWDKELSNALASIKNTASVIVNLLYKKSDIRHPLDGFGFVLPATEKRNIIACGFISKKFSQRAPKDYEIMRVFMGGELAPHLFNLGEEELKQLAHYEISHYLHIKNSPQQVWLTRWSQGLPLYHTGHAQLVEQVESCSRNHPGLFFAGASYYGVGIPDCVRSSEITANMIFESIQSSIQEPIGSHAPER